MNNFPISVSQLAEGMNNAGSMLAVAGNSMEQSIALLTASNVTTQDISKASTGLRTIAARIRKTTTELDELGEAINESKYQEMIQALSGKGVSLTDANGEYRATYDILKDIARVWDQLGSMDQAAIIEALAGTRQQNVFSSIITQFQEAEKAMVAMENSAGALQSAYDVFLESIQAHVNKFKAAFAELATTVVDSGIANRVIDIGTRILELLTGLIGKTGNLRTLLIGIAGVVATIKADKIEAWLRTGPKLLNNLAAGASLLGEKFSTTFRTLRSGGASAFKSFSGAASASLNGVIDLAGSAQVAVAGIFAAFAAVSIISSAIERNRQEKLSGYRDAYSKAIDKSTEKEQLYDLYEAYEIAKACLDDNAESKEALRVAAENLAVALGLEKDAVDGLDGSFKNLTLDELEKAASTALFGAQQAADAIRTLYRSLDDRNPSRMAILKFIDYDDAKKLAFGNADEVADVILRAYDQAQEELDRIAQKRDAEGLTYQEKYLYEGLSSFKTDFAADIDGLRTNTSRYEEVLADIERITSGTVVSAAEAEESLSRVQSKIDSIMSSWSRGDDGDELLLGYLRNLEEAELDDYLTAIANGAANVEEASKWLHNRKLVQNFEALRDGMTDGEIADALEDIAEAAEEAGMSVDDFIMTFGGFDSATAQNISSLLTLEDELQSASQAIKQYNEAISGEHGDVAAQYASAYQKFLEDWNSGKTGTKAVQAAIELFIPDSVLHGLHYDMQAAGKLLASDLYQSIFNQEDSTDYGLNFANFIRENIEQLEGAGVELTNNADGTFNFAYESASKLAYALGMSEDAVIALLDAMDAYGVQIMMSGEDTRQLAEDLGLVAGASVTSQEELQLVADKLAAAGNNSLEIRQALLSLRDAGYIDFDVESAGAEGNLDEIIAKAGEFYQEAERVPTMEIDASQAESAISSVTRGLNNINNYHAKAWIDVGMNLPRSTLFNSIVSGLNFDHQAAGTRDARGGKTLVNELGPELISDNGEAYIANGGRPGFTNLHPHAIVFNAEETKKILSHQYAGIPVQALASGTANRLLKGDRTPAKAAVSSADVASGGGKPTQAYIDNYLRAQVANGVITQQQATQIRDSRISTYSQLLAAVNAAKAANQAAKAAKNSPTAATLISQPVTIAPPSTASSSSSYNNYSSSSYTPTSTPAEPQKVDWIAVRLARIQRVISDLSKIASSGFKRITTRFDAAKSEVSKIQEEIKNQQAGYSRYIREAESVGLSASLAQRVREGDIDINKYDDETREKIQEYEQWYSAALQCQSAVEELHQSIAQLYQDMFDTTQTEYDNKLAQIEHEANMVQKNLDMAQARGYLENASFYEQLADTQSRSINTLQVELQQLNIRFKEAMDSGEIEENSEAWYNMKSAINEVEEAIADANIQLVEYQRTIRQLNWDYFDYAQERFGQLQNEANFLIELMSNDQLFDKRGQFSDLGEATVGARAINFDAYMAQADAYAEELKKVQHDLANDPYDTELIARRETLLGLQQQSILAAEAEKNAVKELVSQGIQLELSALQDLIAAYNDSLDSAKDLYEYQKKITEKTADIASIQKQLSAYAGDTSEETRARVQKLNNDLEKAQTDLRETEWEQNISDQKKLLDDVYSEYEGFLNERLDNIDALMADMIAGTNANLDDIRLTLHDVSDKVGYTMTDLMESALSGDVSDYQYGFDGLSAVSVTLNNIYEMVAAMARASGAVKAYATGGLVDYTGLAAVHGTASRPELMLNAWDTQNFLAAAAMFRESFGMNGVGTRGLAANNGGSGGTSIGAINLTIPIDRVQDYNDFVRQLRDDPKFEKLIDTITLDRLNGKSAFNKNRIKF